MSVSRYLTRTYGSVHKFRAQKRREARALRRAFNDLWYGCAFLPNDAQRHVGALRVALMELERGLSVKEWGR